MPPDAEALGMQPDVLNVSPPALSATTDAVKLEPVPALSATEPGEKEPGVVRDPKTGRFVTVDKAQTPDVDNTTEPAKADAGEPTDGDKQSGEPTGGVKEPDADKTDPATRAIISRFKAQLDAQAAEIALLKAPKPEPPAPRPKYDAYDSPEAYETALTEWAEGEGARKALEKSREDQVKSAQAAQAKAITDAWTQRQTAFRAEQSDYDQVTGPDEAGRPLNIPMHIAFPIAQLDNGPAIEYWLGKNRAEADRIAAMTPILGAAEIGKIAATLAQQAKAPAPKPKPKPITPVGDRSSSLTKSADEMTTEEYAAQMRADGRLKYGQARR